MSSCRRFRCSSAGWSPGFQTKMKFLHGNDRTKFLHRSNCLSVSDRDFNFRNWYDIENRPGRRDHPVVKLRLTSNHWLINEYASGAYWPLKSRRAKFGERTKIHDWDRMSQWFARHHRIVDCSFQSKCAPDQFFQHCHVQDGSTSVLKTRVHLEARDRNFQSSPNKAEMIQVCKTFGGNHTVPHMHEIASDSFFSCGHVLPAVRRGPGPGSRGLDSNFEHPFFGHLWTSILWTVPDLRVKKPIQKAATMLRLPFQVLEICLDPMLSSYPILSRWEPDRFLGEQGIRFIRVNYPEEGLQIIVRCSLGVVCDELQINIRTF